MDLAQDEPRLRLLAALTSGAAQAQDIPGNVRTSASIAKGTAVASRINFAGDTDWFKLTLRDANAYKIVTSGTLAAIGIYNASGVPAVTAAHACPWSGGRP